MSSLVFRRCDLAVSVSPTVTIREGTTAVWGLTVREAVRLSWGIFTLRSHLIDVVADAMGWHPSQVTPDDVVEYLKKALQTHVCLEDGD